MIFISNQTKDQITLDEEWIINVAAKTLMSVTDTNSDITIVIADDSLLHNLNLEYRGIDSATDVLSFNVDELDPETGNLYLGDVIISYQRVIQQSELSGHSHQAELALLIVHGVLHLLGMDHDTPENQQEMWKFQDIILSGLGLELSSPKYG